MSRVTVEKLAAYVKISDKVELGFNNDDYIKNLLTAQLYAQVLKAAEEKGTITVYAPRPTFLDWLFRRYRRIEVSYTLKHLIKFTSSTETLPVIKFDI